MKTNKLFLAALFFAAISFVGCKSKNNVEVESITLDKSNVQLAVGEKVTLTATVTPEGSAEVVWSSSNPAAATVDKGVVTGIADGSALIVATAGEKKASCVVNVGSSGPSGNTFAKYLQGSDYFVFLLDDAAYERIKAKAHDYRVNGGYNESTKLPEEGVTCTMDIWNTDATDANFGTASGPTAFGDPTFDWLYWKSGSLSWGNICGGIRQWRECDFTAITNDYSFVVIYKNPATLRGTNVTIRFYSTEGGENYIDKAIITQSQGDWEVAEWTMQDLFASGLKWSNKVTGDGTNVVYTPGIILEGAGRELEICAIFCYKK